MKPIKMFGLAAFVDADGRGRSSAPLAMGGATTLYSLT